MKTFVSSLPRSKNEVEENASQTASSKIKQTVISIFDSQPIQKEWLGWLSRAFQNVQTTDALLFLLVNGIKDQRFLDNVIPYGIDLIGNAVQQPEVVKGSAQMVQDVLVHEPRVVAQALELCKWFVTQEQVQAITNEWMKTICLRGDVFDTVCWNLQCGCTDACFDTPDVQDMAS